jgi:protease-4
LRINSPGGGVGPSQEIHREVLKARERKKVIASIGSVGASGGYYVACASDLIIVNPGTITGSIGVVMEFSNVEELLKKIGLRSYVIKSGRHKDIGSPLREMTSEEKSILQGVIDSVHSQFIRAVAEGRNMEERKVREIADGRIFSGEQAKELGLVDRLGGLQDAIEIAAEMVGIKGKPTVIYPKKKLSLYEMLFKKSLRLLMDELWQGEYQLSYLMYSP